MTAIKDAVHDHVPVDGIARELLDVPVLQRLRHVRQLSTVALVYPSANHTRFEHSLGVYHLADRALSHLDVDGPRAEHVRAAALLHDVGHGPFGHQTEHVIERRTGRHHDEVEHLLTSGAVASRLDDHGLDPARVAALVAGDGRLGGLVSGALDVDRMDYLARDAHHTGVPYGTVDHGRLVRALRLRDDGLALADGDLRTAESLLLARTLMNATVYTHHVSRIAGAMLDRASERLLDATDLDAGRFARLHDYELLARLQDCDETRDLGLRLEGRNLYKRAIWAPTDAVPSHLVGPEYDRVRELERAIADDAGTEPESVIVDAPSTPSMPEADVRVIVDGKARRLDRVSPLVEALDGAERARWRLGVYAPASVADAVGQSAERILGLEIGERRVRDPME